MAKQKFTNIVRNPDRDLTVAVYFSIEIPVYAPGEPEAVLKAAPDIQALEKLLIEKGYDFQLEMARVRRPRVSEQAQEREDAKREKRE